MGIARRVVLAWLVITAVDYALWQGPDWDHAPRVLQALVIVLYYYQFPGILIHGPHGGYGDWRDPAIVIATTTLFYVGCTFVLIAVWRSLRREPRTNDAA
jgi:hypothetical protein